MTEGVILIYVKLCEMVMLVFSFSEPLTSSSSSTVSTASYVCFCSSALIYLHILLIMIFFRYDVLHISDVINLGVFFQWAIFSCLVYNLNCMLLYFYMDFAQ